MNSGKSIKIEMPMYDWAIICDGYTGYCYANEEDYKFIKSICERMTVTIKQIAKLTLETIINVDLSEDEFITFYDNYWWTLHEGGLCCKVERDNEVMKKIYFLLEDIKSKNNIVSQFDGNDKVQKMFWEEKWITGVALEPIHFKNGCIPIGEKINLIVIDEIYAETYFAEFCNLKEHIGEYIWLEDEETLIKPNQVNIIVDFCDTCEKDISEMCVNCHKNRKESLYSDEFNEKVQSNILCQMTHNAIYKKETGEEVTESFRVKYIGKDY